MAKKTPRFLALTATWLRTSTPPPVRTATTPIGISSPPLTTVRQRPYRMGLAAAKMVVERIEAEDQAEARFERLPVEFVPRQSTAAVVR